MKAELLGNKNEDFYRGFKFSYNKKQFNLARLI